MSVDPAHVDLTVGPRANEERPRPSGQPNVLAIVLDDTGFGQLGCFGSTIETPNIDRLAAEGLRFNRFHVTAMCSPTRAAFLTGRNAHRVGMGFVADIPLDHPGYTSRIPTSAATAPRLFRDAGWATRAIGKWHLVRRFERSDAGPFDSWPLGLGFERYYGFLQGDTSQWHPNLVEDNHYLDGQSDRPAGYHLTEDLVDRALRDITSVRQQAPSKPTFTYLALGAMHAPHHVPREWADRYAGAFDQGWDAWRDEVIERQRDLGVLPVDAVASERPSWVPAWSSLSDDERRLYARQQEVFAGFLSHTDHHIGRLIEGLRSQGALDDTVVMLFSDNGASAEGGVRGSLNEHRFTAMVREDLGDNLAALDDWGGPSTYNHYSWGWAWAGNAPFKLWKRFTWLGGTRTPLIVRHPASIPDPGAVRHQVVHAVDLAPTLYDLAGITPPEKIDGVEQLAFDGVSIAGILADADATEVRTTQYFELLGSRSIIHDGWKATTNHVPEGLLDEEELLEGSRSYDDDRWSLYDLATDFAEVDDVATAHPEVVEELERVWLAEATDNNVLPIFDRLVTRFATMIGPLWPTGQRATFTPLAGPISDEVLPMLFGGFELSCEIADRRGDGVLCALGDRHGGFALAIVNDVAVFTLAGPDLTTTLQSPEPLAHGGLVVSVVFSTEDGGNLGLVVDGTLVAAAPHLGDIPVAFQHGGAQLRLGYDVALSVSDDYRPPARFDGELTSVTISTTGQAVASARDLLRSALRSD